MHRISLPWFSAYSQVSSWIHAQLASLIFSSNFIILCIAQFQSIFPTIDINSYVFTVSPTKPSYMCTYIYIYLCIYIQFSSVQSLSCVQLFVTPWSTAHQASLSITNSQSYALNWWCHPTNSSSVIPFSSCLESFPALGSFPMSQFFTSGGQSIGVSASALVLPMNIQNWFPSGWTGWISLQSSRVFSNTTVQKHQFFSTQLSLQSNFHIHIWNWKSHSFD